MAGSRIWRYSYRDTSMGWRHFWFPWKGTDEWGRRTVVIPIHPFGWVVVVWKTCYCIDCSQVRLQTEQWEADDLHQGDI